MLDHSDKFTGLQSRFGKEDILKVRDTGTDVTEKLNGLKASLMNYETQRP